MANKKTQRRSKPRARAARPAPRVGPLPANEAAVAEAAPEPVTTAPSASPTAIPRRQQPARRTTTTAINYAYLRNDLRTLVFLAPSMIILVVLAFIFIH